MAITGFTVGHILIPLITGVSYCYFVLMLVAFYLIQNKILIVSIVFMTIFGVLSLLYTISITVLLRSNPGTIAKAQISQQRIDNLKRNEQNRKDLLELMEKNITYQQLWDLQKYIKIYEGNTYSYMQLLPTAQTARISNLPEHTIAHSVKPVSSDGKNTAI